MVRYPQLSPSINQGEIDMSEKDLKINGNLGIISITYTSGKWSVTLN
ncbi:hypothetical protein GCM10008938_24320 [Deinococcus roseus]|uniref:Uncharacterized protein n=1 Tax=Deinococcus roseus TaxID=392414 RepID=A0ABQ2CZU5_9DEIO|nr:hypothetical protein GCM10008938_24320 [Deinococcus roseus]